MSSDIPTISGSAATYSISPALPPGLALNTTTGAISGTPTAVSAQTTYAVTAFNSAGATTAVLTIAVGPTPPPPPPPPAPPSNLVYPQTSITAGAGAAIAPDTPTVSGTGISFSVAPALPAGLALDQTTGTISGTPAATSPQTTYTVTATNSTGSTTGTVTITVILTAPSNLVYPQSTIVLFAGSYLPFDTPTVTGLVTNFSVSPALPSGLFCGPTTGAIYGSTGNLYPQATYTVTASNSVGSTTATVTITVVPQAPTFVSYAQPIITATASIPTPPDIPTETGIITSFSSSPALPAGLTLDPASGIISGTPTAGSPKTTYTITGSNVTGSVNTGVTITVAAAPTLLLDLGNAGAIGLASSANVVAVATASGITLLNPNTLAQIGTITGLIDSSSATPVAMSLSSDGTVLAAAQISDTPPGTYGPVNIYSLPSMNLTSTLPAGDISFSLAASGTTILQQTANGWELTDLSGTTVLWSEGMSGPVAVSPDGTLVAANPGLPPSDGAAIYQNGVFVAGLSAYAEGWIDNSTLLGADLNLVQDPRYGNYSTYVTSAIYSASGQTLSTLPTGTIPEILNPQFTGANSVYVPPSLNLPSNAVYSLADGSLLWQGPGPDGVSFGALAGPNVVYIYGSRVLLEPW